MINIVTWGCGEPFSIAQQHLLNINSL